MIFFQPEFSYKLSVTEDLGVSPFEISLEWTLMTLLDFIFATGIPVRSSKQVKTNLSTLLQDAQLSY